MKEGQTQEPVKCNGNCGMNYCDEYGCIENKPEGDVSHLLTPPPAPIKTEVEDVDALATAFADSKERRDCSYWQGLFNGFKYAYAASLPQSSTEEEKDLWCDVLSDLMFDERYPGEKIKDLQSKYKISKI